MPYCKKCGLPLDTGTKICPSCGAEYREDERQADPFAGEAQCFDFSGSSAQEEGRIVIDVSFEKKPPRAKAPRFETESGFDPADVRENRAVAALSYLWLLWIIPLLSQKRSKYARFHANQGLVLFLAEMISEFFFLFFRPLGAMSIVGTLSIAVRIGVYAILLIFAIFGIANAVGGKAKRLPLIGRITLIH